MILDGKHFCKFGSLGSEDLARVRGCEMPSILSSEQREPARCPRAALVVLSLVCLQSLTSFIGQFFWCDGTVPSHIQPTHFKKNAVTLAVRTAQQAVRLVGCQFQVGTKTARKQQRVTQRACRLLVWPVRWVCHVAANGSAAPLRDALAPTMQRHANSASLPQPAKVPC